MYVHVSDEENERRHENCINIVKRHCRIGKVYPKVPKHWLDRAIKRPQPLIPWTPSMEVPQPYFVPMAHGGVCM